jgi:hypothetical protein
MVNDLSSTPNAVPGERLIQVDAKHFRAWLPTLILAVGVMVLFHVIATAWFNRQSSSPPACLAVMADLAVLVGAGLLAGRVFKRLYPSRRSALLSETALVFTDARCRPPEVISIAWDQTVNVLAWRFVIQRRQPRVAMGWNCLAIQLLQDENDVILYTFVPPAVAGQMPGYSRFVHLTSRRDVRESTDLRVSAERRRLLKLEDARWFDGAEISQEDFEAVLTMLGKVVPGWR